MKEVSTQTGWGWEEGRISTCVVVVGVVVVGGVREAGRTKRNKTAHRGDDRVQRAIEKGREVQEYIACVHGAVRDTPKPGQRRGWMGRG